MRKYTIDSSRLAIWEKQNKAELIDYADGCLLDNRLYATKRGTAAIMETFVNCWTSTYTLYFSTDGQAAELFETVRKNTREE